jgi:hypothetical protein
MPIQRRNCNWTRYREQFSLTREDEVDLHFGRRDPQTSYEDVMAEVRDIVEKALMEAQKKPSSLCALRSCLVHVEVRQDNRALGSAPIHAVAGGNAVHRAECLRSGRGGFSRQNSSWRRL